MRRLYPLVLRMGTPVHIGLFGLVSLAMLLVVMPLAESEIRGISGGKGRLDCLFHLRPREVQEHLEALGQAGRAMYAVVEGTAGVLLPLSCALFFTSWLAFLHKESGRLNRLPWLPLPLGAAVASLLKNGGVVALLVIYPGGSDLLVGVSLILNLAHCLCTCLTAGIAAYMTFVIGIPKRGG